jgi:hypothetical protein
MSATFERRVRDYLGGAVRWDDVHQLAIEMEWQDALDVPADIRNIMEDLHMLFLAADD